VIRIAVVCALVVGVVAPAALAADPAPADFKNAARYCKALRSAKGVEAFRTEWGTNKNNAFGKCVSATNKAKAKKNAKDENENETESEAEATGTKSGTE
jgi:hypothetical protein